MLNEPQHEFGRQQLLVQSSSFFQYGVVWINRQECFNSPYSTSVFHQYAEPVPEGETCVQLAAAAKSNNVWLIGGTIPECADGKVYNCSTVYSPSGFLFKYQKVTFL
jgi:omega-amidase